MSLQPVGKTSMTVSNASCDADLFCLPRRASGEREGGKAVMLKLGIATMDTANTIHIPVIKLARVPPTPILDDLGLPLSPTTPTVMGEEVVVEGPGERETFLGQSSREYRRGQCQHWPQLCLSSTRWHHLIVSYLPGGATWFHHFSWCMCVLGFILFSCRRLL